MTLGLTLLLISDSIGWTISDNIVYNPGVCEGNMLYIHKIRDYLSTNYSKVKLINKSIGNTTSAKMSTKAGLAYCGKIDADIAVISLGTNDSFYSTGVSNFIINMTSIINKLKTVNPDIKIILCSPSTMKAAGRLDLQDYRNAISDLATTFATGLCHFENAWTIEEIGTYVATDQVHPKKEGHAKLYEQLLPVLLDYCEDLIENKLISKDKTVTIDAAENLSINILDFTTVPEPVINYIKDERLILDLHAAKADLTNPGTNSPSITTWSDRCNSPANFTLNNFNFNSSSGWAGSGITGDPYCLVLDGINDHLHNSNASKLNIVTKTTIEFWINMLSTPSGLCNLYLDSLTTWLTECCFLPGSLRPTFSSYNGSLLITSSESLLLNTWACVDFIRNGTYGEIRINGATVASGTLSTPRTPSGTKMIGYGLAGVYVNAKIAAVRIYNDNLTVQESLQNYQAGYLAV